MHFNMKRWLMFVSVFVLLIVWQSVQLFITIQADKHQDVESYKQSLIREHPELQIRQTQRFHGDQRYFLFTVENEHGEYEYVYVNEERQILRIPFRDISVSRDDVIEMAKREQSINAVLRVTPAYTGRFTWEIVTRNEQNQLQYLYYSMRDGTYQKRYTLSK